MPAAARRCRCARSPASRSSSPARARRIDKLEAFHPSRVAGRILGMGDVVSLVERAAETIQIEDAEKLAAKMAKGKFDLDDLRSQIAQMQRMGGLGALGRDDAGDEGPEGRRRKGRRRQGAGSSGRDDDVDDRQGARAARDHQRQAQDPHRQGQRDRTVQEVNKLLKMHQEMANAMKRLKKMGGFGKLAAMFGRRRAGRRAGRNGAWGVACPADCPAFPADRPRSIFHPVSTNSQRNNRNSLKGI